MMWPVMGVIGGERKETKHEREIKKTHQSDAAVVGIWDGEHGEAEGSFNELIIPHYTQRQAIPEILT